MELNRYRIAANGFGPIDGKTRSKLRMDAYGFTQASEKQL